MSSSISQVYTVESPAKTDRDDASLASTLEPILVCDNQATFLAVVAGLTRVSGAVDSPLHDGRGWTIMLALWALGGGATEGPRERLSATGRANLKTLGGPYL